MPAPHSEWPHDSPAHAVEHHLRANDAIRKCERNAFPLSFVCEALLTETVAQ